MDGNKNEFWVVGAIVIIQLRNFCNLCLQCFLVNVTSCWSRDRCDDSRRVCPLISHRHQRYFCITVVSARKKARSLINAIRDGGLKDWNKTPTKQKIFGFITQVQGTFLRPYRQKPNFLFFLQKTIFFTDLQIHDFIQKESLFFKHFKLATHSFIKSWTKCSSRHLTPSAAESGWELLGERLRAIFITNAQRLSYETFGSLTPNYV